MEDNDDVVTKVATRVCEKVYKIRSYLTMEGEGMTVQLEAKNFPLTICTKLALVTIIELIKYLHINMVDDKCYYIYMIYQ